MTDGIKTYRNPNGWLTVEEFISMMHNEEIDDYANHHRVTRDKCVPLDIKGDILGCFHCIECFKLARENVKEYKDFYKVGRNKYYKKDLEGQVKVEDVINGQ